MLKFINTIKNKNKTSNQNKIKVMIHHLHEELTNIYRSKMPFIQCTLDQIKGFFYNKKKEFSDDSTLKQFFFPAWNGNSWGLNLHTVFACQIFFSTFVCLIAKLLRSGWRDKTSKPLAGTVGWYLNCSIGCRKLRF